MDNEIILRPEQEAIVITERIRANGEAAANAVFNMCKDLRRMKIEGLYTHLGYESFDDYVKKEFNMERRQAYTYISVYEKYEESFLQSNAQLGITKLSMLTQVDPEDRAEIIANNDVSEMTTRQLKELMDKYKNQGEQLSLLEEENQALKKQKEELKNELDTFPELEVMRQQNEEAEKRIQELEEKIKEKDAIAEEFKNFNDKLHADNMALNRELKEQKTAEPIIKEVIKEVPDKKALEKKDKTIAKLQEEVKKLTESNEKKENEIAAKQSEYEAKIADLKKTAEKPAEDPDKHSFKALFTSAYKEITGLIEFVKSAEDKDKELFISKVNQLLETSGQALKEAESHET